MVTLEEANRLLSKPFDDSNDLPDRSQSAYRSLQRFRLASDRPYQQQFGDMYFLRLAKIKPAVEKVAVEAFGDVIVAGEPPKQVDRVLDVRQGEFCWVAGTVYMDMPFKPSILDDVSKDRLLSLPPDVKKYIPEDGDDDLLAEGRGSVSVMLEDESGRIRLVGKALRSVLLVTGCIAAVMGTENENGELEVLDIVFPDLPPQPARWELSGPPTGDEAEKQPPTKRVKVEEEDDDDDLDMDDDGHTDHKQTQRSSSSSGNKIAIVSGLRFSGPHGAAAVETALLLEYLLGEALSPASQRAAARISRLIVAGNSIVAAPVAAAAGERQPTKKYGYDSSTYDPVPSAMLDEFLAQLLPSMPVTLMPGPDDPSNASIPQQPVHAAMFPQARAFSTANETAAEPGSLDAVTNPWEGEVAGWRILGTSGQTLDDMQRYVQSSDRLGMMEATCRWRCCAPTAPDTLWSYPFQEDDPFVMDACPHVYFAGSQPEFGTRLISGPDGQEVRLVAVPSFSESPEIALVDTDTLEVTRVKIGRSE
ncbi:DNA polymerase delta subunit [Grosmannia clavigera kw1407]|uniref:DNA-directed DNA polymerase n=1 Tax=Grosmannia clavigera (strain kw1407 / UAMH 11150) TaxID=655863 RepID=F0XEG2_GROCL|nr:DNA polymerase delta subunit [Grosmannia clavigera kw1407]EFX03435.1 DNA polymerase delta subunit [Grosmannia clavigera kw1407]